VGSGRDGCGSAGLLCWLAVTALLLGCGDREQPRLEPASARKPPVAAPFVGPPLPPPAITHKVRPGETLWDISRAYGVSVDAILRQSGLTQRDVPRLMPGAELKIPGASQAIDVMAAKKSAAPAEPIKKPQGGAYHQLQPGESLWTLARSYDVPLETLMERNGLTDEQLTGLRVGHPIIIPGVAQTQLQSAVTKPRAGFTHILAPGETVWDIGNTYKVGVGEIMAANGLDAVAVSRMQEGRRLFIPGVERDSGGVVRHRTSDRERRARAVAERLGLGGLQAAAALLHGRVEPRWIAAAGDLKRLPGTLRWPVTNGNFVRGYGSGQDGYHKAMDIRGDLGWNVRAAAAGIVGYAGNQVKGFGNMIMLIHAGGWVTLYGHNSVNFVTAGETVPRGGVLAEVGSTGRSQGPHVHFELIYAGTNCDPAPLFRPGVRHKRGLARLNYTVWQQPDKRPASVQCARRQKHPPAHEVLAENPERDATPAATDTIPESEARPEEP
jgi:murein DD-endopeptidase MepM/ murein hydrolase activator NlpD